MSIAMEILEQLGGNKFVVNTGSENLRATRKGLTMKLSRNTAKAKWLKIELNSLDLYDMVFLSKGKNLSLIIKMEYNNVCADQLRELFIETTGLYTSLGTMGR